MIIDIRNGIVCSQMRMEAPTLRLARLLVLISTLWSCGSRRWMANWKLTVSAGFASLSTT